MCKLLVLKDHPPKFIECKEKCSTVTNREWAEAGVVLYLVIVWVGLVGAYLFS